MWTFDEVLAINAPAPGQRRSALDHLLLAGAASPELLCKSADILEKASVPSVCIFAQLPYQFELSPPAISIAAARKGLRVEVLVDSLAIQLDKEYRIVAVPLEPTQGNDRWRGTQLRVLVPLWGAWARYFAAYSDCVSDEGIEDKVIVSTESNWIRLPGGQSSGVLRANAFGNHLVKRVVVEAVAAIERLTAHASLAALQEFTLPNPLPGVFAMTVPGRVTYAMHFVPLAETILSSYASSHPQRVAGSRVEALLRYDFARLAHFHRRLLVLKEVARKGEIPLAIIGLVSALEGYVNDVLDNREPKSIYLSNALKKHPFTTLPEILRQRLFDACEVRNELTHGRYRNKRPTASIKKSIEKTPLTGDTRRITYGYVRQLVEDCVTVYKKISDILRD